MPFALKKQKAVLEHLNTRAEKHGDQNMLAIDIKIVADVPNTFLNQLDPTLRASLYKAEGDQASLIEDAEHMPVLRYEYMSAFKYTVSMVKAKLTIHGAKKENDITFEVKINGIKLDCKHGGTVELTFSAATLPEAEDVGTLSGLLKQDVRVTVSGGQVADSEQPPSDPPAVGDQAQLH